MVTGAQLSYLYPGLNSEALTVYDKKLSLSVALAEDELELISTKLTFGPDYTRFRSVCKSWRSAAPKRPQLPWLIVHDDRTLSDVETNFFSLYQFSFETNKFTQICELSESPLLSTVDDLTVCIGSSYGWVAFFNRRTSSVSLSNLLTNSTFDLPNLQNWYDIDSSSDINTHRFSFILTSDPGESFSNCFALIYCPERILYCKVGCSGWIEMHQTDFDGFKKIHFCCYRGRIFFASGIDVFVCDFGWFGWNPSVCKIVSIDSYNTRIRDLLFRIQESYLVESDADLLLALVYGIDCNEDCCEDCDEHYCFQTFKLEFDWQLVKLVEVTTLGDKSLILGLKTTFSLTASKYPGCKENSIYLPLLSYDSVVRRIIQVLVIYDFKEGKSVFIKDDYSPDDAYTIYCAWFTPSLLM